MQLGRRAERRIPERGPDVRRCTRCTMPETFQGITFDEDGVCSLCTATAAKHESPRRLAELGEVVRSYGRGGNYDCVVPLSGGKDSTYILYSAVRDLGLRVIAVNYDSGYQSDEGRDNVRNACEALGVEAVLLPEDVLEELRENGRMLV